MYIICMLSGMFSRVRFLDLHKPELLSMDIHVSW